MKVIIAFAVGFVLGVVAIAKVSVTVSAPLQEQELEIQRLHRMPNIMPVPEDFEESNPPPPVKPEEKGTWI